MAEPIIKLRQLTKMYGSARGVQDVDLEVSPGTVFGFLGPNGAGKSTTINMLLDFIRPTSGSVTLFGMDAQKDSVKIRRRIGFLAGDMAMDSGLTGWQQLSYFGHLRGRFDEAYVRELAERLSFSMDRKFKALSRGNRQKVGLIAALMHKPELLILDEPTSGLDPLIQAEFNKIIREHKEAGGTAFISSHMLSEVQEICDTVTFIREGKIIITRPVSAIAKDMPKDFAVATKSKDLLKKLQQLPGLEVSTRDGGMVRGVFNGDVNELLRLLGGYTVESFSLSEAELESAFMKFYESEAGSA